MAEATVARARPTAGVLSVKWSPAVLALAALMGVAGVLLLYGGRHLTFFFDEWNFILDRRGGGVSAYLDPHNGHLVLFPVLVYKLLFKVVGLRHYAPYLAVVVALHLLCCGLLYVLARRRLGPWRALMPTTLLLFMGSAYQDLLWPFQMGYLASVAGGLGALASIDGAETEAPGRTAAAAALLTWALFSSGVGAAFVAACAVMLLVRRDPWRRLWIVALPLALFGVWYLGWGTGEHVAVGSLPGVPKYDVRAAAAALAGIAGLDQGWYHPRAIALAVALAVAWWRRRDLKRTPMLAAAVAGALTFWTLAAVVRADLTDPTASRYLYVSAVFLLLIAAEARLGERVRGRWLAVAALLVLAAAVLNVRLLRQGERGLRKVDTSVRASLAALELAGPVVSAAFQPDPVGAPQITAGRYLAAVHDLGSPALSVSELARAPAGLQIQTDGLLLHAERVSVAPTRGPISGSCRQLGPDAAGALELAVPAGSELAVQTSPGHGTVIYSRRFASQFGPSPLGFVPAGRRATVRFPSDRASGVPWHVRLSSSQSLRACVS